MILLDPDLSSTLLPASRAAKQASAAADLAPRAQRLPTVPTLTRFLVLAQAAVRLKGQVTVLLTTDPAIRKLNRQFRGKNKATDVLSFPCEGNFPGLPASQQMAGDLAISVPTALKQSLEQGHSLSTEVKVLLLHGLLHLYGLDHETDAGQMARRERLLRGKLKLPQGLIERVENEGTREQGNKGTETKGLGNRGKGKGIARRSASSSKTASKPGKAAKKASRGARI